MLVAGALGRHQEQPLSSALERRQAQQPKMIPGRHEHWLPRLLKQLAVAATELAAPVLVQTSQVGVRTRIFLAAARIAWVIGD